MKHYQCLITKSTDYTDIFAKKLILANILLSLVQ